MPAASTISIPQVNPWKPQLKWVDRLYKDISLGMYNISNNTL